MGMRSVHLLLKGTFYPTGHAAIFNLNLGLTGKELALPAAAHASGLCMTVRQGISWQYLAASDCG